LTQKENPDTDYSAVTIPDEKPTEEYHWTERRADILQRIEEAGHPSMLSQRALAQEFDVSDSQISRDMDRISEHIRTRLRDRSHRAVVVDTVVQRCVQELMSDGEFRAAAKTILEWEEFASSFSDLEELHDRVAQLEAEQPTTVRP
jgi:DNA-binding transcriptional MocR family regulator